MSRPTYLRHTLQHRLSGEICNVRQYPEGTLGPEVDFTHIGFWTEANEASVKAAIDVKASVFVLLDTALVTPGHD